MSQCIVVNTSESGDWIDQVRPHPQGLRALGMHMPPKSQPALIHPNREAAEVEAARLACACGQSQAEFAVFELVSVVRGQPVPAGVGVKGLGPGGLRIPRWDEDPVAV